MSLKLGSTNVNKVYLGGTEINKVYLGNTEVFGGGAIPSTNLILNGTFDDGSNLTLGTSWSIIAGTADYNAGQDSSQLTFTTSVPVTATTYNLDFEITSGATARFAININGVEVVGSTNYGIGTHSVPFTYAGADFSGISLRARNASGGTAFAIDNVELTQV